MSEKRYNICICEVWGWNVGGVMVTKAPFLCPPFAYIKNPSMKLIKMSYDVPNNCEKYVLCFRTTKFRHYPQIFISKLQNS